MGCKRLSKVGSHLHLSAFALRVQQVVEAMSSFSWPSATYSKRIDFRAQLLELHATYV
jgi:hypothetical protein